MRRISESLAPVLVCFALVACDTAPSVDAGPNPDTDAGPRRDAGPVSNDPCASDSAGALAGVGCNGGLIGPTPSANEIGGGCTPDNADPPGAGTCVASPGSQAVCLADEGETTGTCVYACPDAMTYVSTGGCPSGSRCFPVQDLSLCFRDCTSSADCFTGETCDSEGSCLGAQQDGGPPVAVDAGPPTDAGPPVDAGPPGCACDTGAGCQFDCGCDPACEVALGRRCDECDEIFGSVGNCFQTGAAVVTTCGGSSSGDPSTIPYCRRGAGDENGYCTISCTSATCTSPFECMDTNAGINGCLR